jgi:hypothetical protein
LSVCNANMRIAVAAKNRTINIDRFEVEFQQSAREMGVFRICINR